MYVLLVYIKIYTQERHRIIIGPVGFFGYTISLPCLTTKVLCKMHGREDNQVTQFREKRRLSEEDVKKNLWIHNRVLV